MIKVTDYRTTHNFESNCATGQIGRHDSLRNAKCVAFGNIANASRYRQTSAYTTPMPPQHVGTCVGRRYFASTSLSMPDVCTRKPTLSELPFHASHIFFPKRVRHSTRIASCTSPYVFLRGILGHIPEVGPTCNNRFQFVQSIYLNTDQARDKAESP